MVVDAGFELKEDTMRAPDVSVAPPKKNHGWFLGAPPLAVEYADRGQNEADLQKKIKELLAAGTRYVWVVRLIGPQRVEVYAKGKTRRILSATDLLEAPGILRNSIPVHALFDADAAYRVTLRNLLQRKGYDSLEMVRQEGESEGRTQGKAERKAEGSLEARINALFTTLRVRGIDVDAETRSRIRDCRDEGQLEAWLAKAVVATRPVDIFGS
uniref:Restriction endonuclease n=1 Tax=Candidatus Kentrum sp. MB TaxID=2138164 RepID=A0A451BG64_9GAMM|nr:MAG: Putative restriction endonuclease [Candidatus Kentron sp. MB]VFK35386.1 MAG: Putative restriction endonuclease [Candidatus Kentron sp. MB]VFK77271.1 MAG: Putative restriction endonuclease [Candidatus Kentron sp. MB]